MSQEDLNKLQLAVITARERFQQARDAIARKHALDLYASAIQERDDFLDRELEQNRA